MVYVYTTKIKWRGGRKGEIKFGYGYSSDFSSPPEFGGEAGHLTPEEAFVASVNMNFMETFLSLAEKRGVRVVEYSSDANGILGQKGGKEAIVRVVVHPDITVESEEDLSQLREVVDAARKQSLVMASINSTIVVEFRASIRKQ